MTLSDMLAPSDTAKAKIKAGPRLPFYPQFDVMDTQDFSRVADSEALGDSPTLAI